MPDHTAPLGAGHDTYATSTRADILPLVDRRYPHVLDVGCSAGNTGALMAISKQLLRMDVDAAGQCYKP